MEFAGIAYSHAKPYRESQSKTVRASWFSILIVFVEHQNLSIKTFLLHLDINHFDRLLCNSSLFLSIIWHCFIDRADEAYTDSRKLI